MGTDGRHRRAWRASHQNRESLSLSPDAYSPRDAGVSVSERSERWDTYQLTNFTRDNLQLFIARKYIDDKTRAALETIIALKDKVAAASVRLQLIDKESAEIAHDQQRLRENISALTSTTEAKQPIARYVSKANEQETRLEQLEAERRMAAAERARLHTELDLAIRTLSLDRKL